MQAVDQIERENVHIVVTFSSVAPDGFGIPQFNTPASWLAVQGA